MNCRTQNSAIKSAGLREGLKSNLTAVMWFNNAHLKWEPLEDTFGSEFGEYIYNTVCKPSTKE